VRDGDDDSVKQTARALDDIEMAVGDGVVRG
jgi:hypothetical protein